MTLVQTTVYRHDYDRNVEGHGVIEMIGDGEATQHGLHQI